MNRQLIELLKCPHCGSTDLELKEFNSHKLGPIEGAITCLSCLRWYRIDHGILDFLPDNLTDRSRKELFAKKHKLHLYEHEDANSDAFKLGQAKFFDKCVDDYEKNVVHSPYYEALYEVTFMDWVKRNLVKGQRVLDVGCGTGKQGLLMAERGIHAIGIDVSEKMLRRAYDKARNQSVLGFIDLILADGERPPFRDGVFKSAILGGFLHHLQDPGGALKSIVPLLISQGLVYTSDPHDSPVRFIFDLMMKKWKLYEEEASDDPLISKERLKKWFNEAGLSCQIKISTYLPPHMMYKLSVKTNRRLLKVSDTLFNAIPGVNRFGGVIIAQGEKIKRQEVAEIV